MRWDEYLEQWRAQESERVRPGLPALLRCVPAWWWWLMGGIAVLLVGGWAVGIYALAQLSRALP